MKFHFEGNVDFYFLEFPFYHETITGITVTVHLTGPPGVFREVVFVHLTGPLT